MKRVGLLLNPIAGMGGRVGLKGTDGVVEKALELGAEPVSPLRMKEALEDLLELREVWAPDLAVHWLTSGPPMGGDLLKEYLGPSDEMEIVYQPGAETTAEDTRAVCRRFLEKGIDVLLFCGGDGTARDILDVVKLKVPILGIPSGVKMHSGVFGVNPRSTSELLVQFLIGRISTNEVEVLDLDEERYREGEWNLKLYGVACTPHEPSLVQSSKMMFEEIPDEEVKRDIANYIAEMVEKAPDTLFILGPGSTLATIGKRLEIEKTLLGIDAVLGGTVVGKDLNEEGLLALLEKHEKAKLVVSPIGAQGFILGRGNLQLSPRVIRKLGVHNIIVVSAPAKLARTPILYVDTGDEELNSKLTSKNYIPVIVGYHTIHMHPIRA